MPKKVQVGQDKPKAKKISNPCDTCLDVLQSLKVDHGIIIEHVNEFKDHLQGINANTKDMVDTLKEFHTDNREYVKIIAGKKQVPLSIFAMIIILLVTLLVASEVRYSKLDITVGKEGIKVINPHDVNTNTTENN